MHVGPSGDQVKHQMDLHLPEGIMGIFDTSFNGGLCYFFMTFELAINDLLHECKRDTPEKT